MDRNQIKQRAGYTFNQNRKIMLRVAMIIELLASIPSFFNTSANVSITDTQNFTAQMTKVTPSSIIFLVLTVLFMCISHGYVVSTLKMLTNRSYEIKDTDSLVGFTRFLELFPTYFLRAVFIFLFSILPCFSLVFLAVLSVYLTKSIAFYILFLMAALIISGFLTIRNYLNYAMVPYLLEERGLKMMAALKTSRDMMDGHRMDLLKLYLSYIPWYILLALVMTTIQVGLGTFMPMPLAVPVSIIGGALFGAYLFKGVMATAIAIFYEELAYRYFR